MGKKNMHMNERILKK